MEEKQLPYVGLIVVTFSEFQATAIVQRISRVYDCYQGAKCQLLDVFEGTTGFICYRQDELRIYLAIYGSHT